MFFCRYKRRRLLKKKWNESLKKGPPQAPLLSVWVVAKKNAPSIWTPFKKKRNTFKQKQHMFFNFIIYVIISLTVFSHLFFICFLMFSLFPRKFKSKGWLWI